MARCGAQIELFCAWTVDAWLEVLADVSRGGSERGLVGFGAGNAGRSGELAAVIVRVHSQELLVDLVRDPGTTHPVRRSLYTHHAKSGLVPASCLSCWC